MTSTNLQNTTGAENGEWSKTEGFIGYSESGYFHIEVPAKLDLSKCSTESAELFMRFVRSSLNEGHTGIYVNISHISGSPSLDVFDVLGCPKEDAKDVHVAVQVSSLSLYLIVSFFMRYYAPSYPIKIFRNRNSAMNWLHKEKDIIAKKYESN